MYFIDKFSILPTDCLTVRKDDLEMQIFRELTKASYFSNSPLFAAGL